MNSRAYSNGFFVGGLLGLTGAGDASPLTPLLIFLGIIPLVQFADFIYNSTTKLAGAIHHVKTAYRKLPSCKVLSHWQCAGGSSLT